LQDDGTLSVTGTLTDTGTVILGERGELQTELNGGVEIGSVVTMEGGTLGTGGFAIGAPPQAVGGVSEVGTAGEISGDGTIASILNYGSIVAAGGTLTFEPGL
jgi:archaellum biogenesis ATPase FlaH